jgi:hypothetical protein
LNFNRPLPLELIIMKSFNRKLCWYKISNRIADEPISPLCVGLLTILISLHEEIPVTSVYTGANAKINESHGWVLELPNNTSVFIEVDRGRTKRCRTPQVCYPCVCHVINGQIRRKRRPALCQWKARTLIFCDIKRGTDQSSNAHVEGVKSHLGNSLEYVACRVRKLHIVALCWMEYNEWLHLMILALSTWLAYG